MDKINSLPNYVKVLIIIVVLPIFLSSMIFFAKVNEYFVLQEEYDIYKDTTCKEISRLDSRDVSLELTIKDVSSKLDNKTDKLSDELESKFNKLDNKVDKIYQILINMQKEK